MVSQGILVASGAQNEVDFEQVLIEGALSVPGMAAGAVLNKALKPLFRKIEDKAVKKAAKEAWQTYKSARKDLTKQIKSQFNVSSKEANAIADDIARKAQESVNSQAQFSIRLNRTGIETTVSTLSQSGVNEVVNEGTEQLNTIEMTITQYEKK